MRDNDKLRSTDIDALLYIRTLAGWNAEAFDRSVSKEEALIALAADLVLSNPLQLD